MTAIDENPKEQLEREKLESFLKQLEYSGYGVYNAGNVINITAELNPDEITQNTISELQKLGYYIHAVRIAYTKGGYRKGFTVTFYKGMIAWRAQK